MSKISQEILCLIYILKFESNVGYYLLYCVKENQVPPIYHTLHLSILLYLHISDTYCSAPVRASLQILRVAKYIVGKKKKILFPDLFLFIDCYLRFHPPCCYRIGVLAIPVKKLYREAGETGHPGANVVEIKVRILHFIKMQISRSSHRVRAHLTSIMSFISRGTTLTLLLPIEPHHEKTCLWGFRPGPTHTDLLSYIDELGS